MKAIDALGEVMTCVLAWDAMENTLKELCEDKDPEIRKRAKFMHEIMTEALNIVRNAKDGKKI